MSKKRTLWTISLIGFIALNFIPVERATVLSFEYNEEEYKEFFAEKFAQNFHYHTTPLDKRLLSPELFEAIRSTDLVGTVAWRIPTIKVAATIYKPFYPMTDITASGLKIDTISPSDHRWIAVSRDLLKAGFDFGTKVQITGTKTHDGIWEVQDVMHPRWKKRIDFLSEKDARLDKWSNITMTKIN